MIQEHHEIAESQFQGTIIDIETIGEFSQIYKFDSRRCKDIKQVIFGYINQEHLHIYCARSALGIDKLKLMTPEIITHLTNPFMLLIAVLKAAYGFTI